MHDYYEALPFFKKIFVSRENLIGEVDDLVNDSLPKRIEETLKGDFFADEARNFINGSIDDALARPLPDIVGTIDPRQLDRLKAQISKSILSVLRGDEMLTSISAYLKRNPRKTSPAQHRRGNADAAPRFGRKAQEHALKRPYEHSYTR